MNTPTPNTNSKTSNTWKKQPYFSVNDFSPINESTVDDDSDLHQRCRCDEFRSRAEFHSFMTHDTMELTRNLNRRHWNGLESARSNSHSIR